MSKDQFLNNISKKTNVSKQDILKLASDLQSKNLADENNIRDLVKKIAVLANKEISKEKEDHIIGMVKNDKIPKNLDKMIK